MHITSKHAAVPRPLFVTDAVPFSGEDSKEDWLEPVELESWSVEELEDVLPHHEMSTMDDIGIPTDHRDSIAQMYGLIE